MGNGKATTECLPEEWLQVRVKGTLPSSKPDY